MKVLISSLVIFLFACEVRREKSEYKPPIKSEVTASSSLKPTEEYILKYDKTFVEESVFSEYADSDTLNFYTLREDSLFGKYKLQLFGVEGWTGVDPGEVFKIQIGEYYTLNIDGWVKVGGKWSFYELYDIGLPQKVIVFQSFDYAAGAIITILGFDDRGVKKIFQQQGRINYEFHDANKPSGIYVDLNGKSFLLHGIKDNFIVEQL